MNLEKPFFTGKEAADILGVHFNTIQRWVRAGALAVVRAGERGHYRIPREAIFKDKKNANKLNQ